MARLHLWNDYGLDEHSSQQEYSFYEYFDITDPDRPLWRSIFFPDSFEGMSTVPVYRVELNARTGGKVTVETYEWQQIFDESA